MRSYSALEQAGFFPRRCFPSKVCCQGGLAGGEIGDILDIAHLIVSASAGPLTRRLVFQESTHFQSGAFPFFELADSHRNAKAVKVSLCTDRFVKVATMDGFFEQHETINRLV